MVCGSSRLYLNLTRVSHRDPLELMMELRPLFLNMPTSACSGSVMPAKYGKLISPKCVLTGGGGGEAGAGKGRGMVVGVWREEEEGEEQTEEGRRGSRKRLRAVSAKLIGLF